jgi:hypothetical protein
MQSMTGRGLAAFVVSGATLLTVSATAFGQDAARGAALVALARQALGGDRLAAVKTLHVAGTFRRVVGGNDTEGDFEVFLERPDKYLRSEKTGTPGQPSVETIEALVAGEVRDVARGGGRGVRGGGGIGGGGADSPPDAAVEAPADADVQPGATAPAAGRARGFGPDPEAQRRTREADVARLLLMWLAAADVPSPWVGVAESPEGKADVLEFRFADGQPTRLFLESMTHMPLMMQWSGVPARAARGGRRGGGTPQQAVTLEMTFTDHRVVNGIRLPHVITRGANGETTERWNIRSYRINPSFNAQTFTR